MTPKELTLEQRCKLLVKNEVVYDASILISELGKLVDDHSEGNLQEKLWALQVNDPQPEDDDDDDEDNEDDDDEEKGLEPREVFNYWIVTGYLANKLEAHGETIDRNLLGLTIWRRTCTGQSVYCDRVIKEIVTNTRYCSY